MDAEERARISDCLRAGEELLWCGSPVKGWWDDRNALWIGLGFLTLVLVAAFTLADPNTWAYCPEFLICMVLFGFVGVVLLPFVRYWQKRHMVYGLTNERAIVLTGRGVKSYPLKPYMVVEYEAASKGCTGKLLFAYKEFFCYPVETMKVGFRNLPDTETPLGVLQSRLTGQLFAEHMPAWDRESAERELALRVARHPLSACARLAVELAFILIVCGLMYRHIVLRGDMVGYINVAIGCMVVFDLCCTAWRHLKTLFLGRRLLREEKPAQQ